MSHPRYAPRSWRPSPAALQALDFGLRVRVEAHSSQRSIFTGAEDLSVRDLGLGAFGDGLLASGA